MPRPAPLSFYEESEAIGDSVLSGVRVVEIATVLAGPGSARHLADFGADVIKIEKPPHGDSVRRMGWTPADGGDSYMWKMANRGKRCMMLDLQDSEDLEIVRKLLLEADLLVENMRPGKLENLGLTPEVLLRDNPKLCILRVTGFGQTGPYAQMPGFATVAEALSGLPSISGEPNGPPMLPPIALTDEVTALAAAFGSLLALRHAERTGRGQIIDANLLETMLQLMGPLPAAYQHLGYLQPRLGSGIPFTVPRGLYQCSDGQWVALSASSDSVAHRLLKLLGVAEDDRFRSFQERSRHREALELIVSNWIAERTRPEVLESIASVDAAIAPVHNMADVVADAHVRERGILREVDGILMQGPVVGLSATPGVVRWAGPPMTEDDDSGGSPSDTHPDL
jgi:crotonobetainyl-CoA:carnitine CoA-transferase CaiB-like acyl-CoA transferase